MNIKKRIKTLELKIPVKDSIGMDAIFIECVNPDGTVDPIIGYSRNGQVFDRLPGEAIEDLQAWCISRVQPESRKNEVPIFF